MVLIELDIILTKLKALRDHFNEEKRKSIGTKWWQMSALVCTLDHIIKYLESDNVPKYTPEDFRVNVNDSDVSN